MRRDGLASLRTRVEHAFETVFFGVVSLFVLGGMLAMCVHPTLFAH